MKEKKFRVLSMCDFCSKSIATCGAKPVFGKDVDLGHEVEPKNAVIACDKYESPVDVLKKQFH